MSVDQSLFVLADASKCTGCRACELACFAGHRAKKAGTIGCVTEPIIPRLYLAKGAEKCMPVQCHHCEDAPCLRSCLTGAISREDGAVLLDPRKCIGCRNCAIACPFGAIEVFSMGELGEQCEVPRLVYKCDLCHGEKEQACVAVCPNEAIRLVDPETELNAKRIAAVSATEAFETAPALAAATAAAAQEQA